MQTVSYVKSKGTQYKIPHQSQLDNRNSNGEAKDTLKPDAKPRFTPLKKKSVLSTKMLTRKRIMEICDTEEIGKLNNSTKHLEALRAQIDIVSKTTFIREVESSTN